MSSRSLSSPRRSSNQAGRFHSLYFPAILMALDLPLPKRLLVHSHWTVEKKKMSKSVGNVIDPFETMSTYGSDAVRYLLARVGGRFKYDVGACLFPSPTLRPRLYNPSPACRNYRLVKEPAPQAQHRVDVPRRKLLL